MGSLAFSFSIFLVVQNSEVEMGGGGDHQAGKGVNHRANLGMIFGLGCHCPDIFVVCFSRGEEEDHEVFLP